MKILIATNTMILKDVIIQNNKDSIVKSTTKNVYLGNHLSSLSRFLFFLEYFQNNKTKRVFLEVPYRQFKGNILKLPSWLYLDLSWKTLWTFFYFSW